MSRLGFSSFSCPFHQPKIIRVLYKRSANHTSCYYCLQKFTVRCIKVLELPFWFASWKMTKNTVCWRHVAKRALERTRSKKCSAIVDSPQGGDNCHSFQYRCLIPCLFFLFLNISSIPLVVRNDDAWQAQASVISDNTLLRRYIVTNGKAILRHALPIPVVDEPIKELQSTLELLLIDLHAPGKSGLSLAWKDIQKAEQILHKGEVEILLDTGKGHRDEAAVVLGDVDQLLGVIGDEIRMAKNSRKTKDWKNDIAAKTEISLDKVAQLEEWMVDGFPYSIPHKYDSLPRLKGRATVEMTITKGSTASDPEFRDKDGNPIGRSIRLVAVLDGYSAPLTSGNFLQALLNNVYQDATVVDKDPRFYLFVQPKQLFMDPQTHKPRRIPMEVLVDGDPYPIWGQTLESADLADLQPVLPMTAFGALAMAHSDENENDANSSFFIFLLDPRSEQARNKGGNIFNGNVATFGYIVQGLEYLAQISSGDTITHSRICSGMDKWELPSSSS